jgi:hypothetical protein
MSYTFEDQELTKRLQSGRCRCGGPKAPGRTFCKECYFRLPPAFRQSLYQRVGKGYAQAYAAAEKALYGATADSDPLGRARAADAMNTGDEAV